MTITSRFLLGTLLAACTGTPVYAAPETDTALDAVLARFDHDEHPDLGGVVVMRDGQIVAERYYNGATADTLHDIRSAGKSITALLAGIAIDQGSIRNVDEHVARNWPASKDSAVGDVTLRHLLTMQSGLAADDEDDASPGSEDRMDEAADPLAFVLAIPRADTPGTRYVYNSVAAYVAGVVIARATHQSLAEFARHALFAPLGITQWRWASDAAGQTKGQGNLSLTPRGMARIGEMVRNGGRHAGRQIVSAAFLHDALMSHVDISGSDPYADGYGYLWYVKTYIVDGTSVPVSFASGNGGNKIYVIPTQQLVIAITSGAYGQGRGQRRSEEILTAVLASEQRRRTSRELD